jgi:hypothetical protein
LADINNRRIAYWDLVGLAWVTEESVNLKSKCRGWNMFRTSIDAVARVDTAEVKEDTRESKKSGINFSSLMRFMKRRDKRTD